MQLAEPLVSTWKASLSLHFARGDNKTVLQKKQSDGPLVVQKPLYPEGPEVCHAIVVHPPGGIAGGDELLLQAKADRDTSVLLTTPGAGKWYRTAGPWAKQKLAFDVEGTLEWLPRETIVFNGARAGLECTVNLGPQANFIGWEVLCFGRRGSGERFDKGELRTTTRVLREGKLLFYENGRVDGGGRMMKSAAGLGGKSVFGTMLATCSLEKLKPEENMAVTQLPGLLVARYLGDSGEEALEGFAQLWSSIRPAVAGRAAVKPRIWST